MGLIHFLDTPSRCVATLGDIGPLNVTESAGNRSGAVFHFLKCLSV